MAKSIKTPETVKANHRFACAIFAFIVSLSFTGCNSSKTITYTTKIDSLEWTAIAEIQEWKTCDESGWEVPEGAVVYKEQEEVKFYKIVGYETKSRTEEYQEKVGYYLPTWRPKYETRTRTISYQEPIKEPVYATKYYYTIERWVHTKNAQLGHGYNKDCSYDEYVCAENERVDCVEETYTVWFKVGDHWQGCYVEKEHWESLQVGQEIAVEKNQYGIIHVNWDAM